MQQNGVVGEPSHIPRMANAPGNTHRPNNARLMRTKNAMTLGVVTLGTLKPKQTNIVGWARALEDGTKRGDPIELPKSNEVIKRVATGVILRTKR